MSNLKVTNTLTVVKGNPFTDAEKSKPKGNTVIIIRTPKNTDKFVFKLIRVTTTGIGVIILC